MSTAFLEFPPHTRDMGGGGQSGHVIRPPEVKNCGEKSFSNLGNMHIFGKPCISGIRKYINTKYVTPMHKMAHNGTKITHGETR
jgi:hypothetical protein